MLWFDFQKLLEAKITLLDFEEKDKLQAELEKIHMLMKVFLGSSILSIWVIFILMKDSSEIFPWFPLWLFVIILVITAQISVGLFIKKLLSKPIEEDILKWEKVEIITKIVNIVTNSKWKYLEIFHKEVTEYIVSLVSLENYTIWEDVLLGIAPKTMKIVSIKKIS